MNNQRKIGAILSYSNVIAKNLITFMYVPFLLRFVGQANYGLFQMTNSVMSSLGLLSMGFSSAYVKFYITYKVNDDENNIEKLNALYLLIFIFISFISLIVGSILVLNINHLFSQSLTPHQIILMRYLMIVLVIDMAVTFISSVFDSNIIVNEQFIFQQTRQLMKTFLVPLICVPLVLVGVGVLSIVITQLMITILFLILNMNYCFKNLNMRFRFNNLPIKLFKEVGTFSIFIFLNQIVDLVNNNAPNFILGMFRGAKMVATFSVAIMMKNMFFMLSGSLSNVFIPRVHQLVDTEQGTDVLTEFMVKVGRIQMTILFFILGGFIIVGKYFIRIWAGSDNINAYGLIIFMILPAIIPLSQNIGVEIQRAMNKQVFRSVIYIVFAVINVVCTVIGSIEYGLIGAASGYVISIIFANGFAMNWYYQSIIHLDMKRYWIETLKVIVPFVSVTTFLGIVKIFVKVETFKVFITMGIIYVLAYVFVYLRFTANEYEKKLIGNFKGS